MAVAAATPEPFPLMLNSAGATVWTFPATLVFVPLFATVKVAVLGHAAEALSPSSPRYRAEPVLSEVEGRSTRVTPLQFVGRKSQRRDEVRIGLVASAQPAEHLAQCQVRAPVIVQGDACLEIRLRLAPQLLALA